MLIAVQNRTFQVFAVFTVIPTLELYLMLRVGAYLGSEATVAVALVTGLLGAALVQRERNAAVQALKDLVEKGLFPPEGLIEWVGSCLLTLVGGVLLLTPGLVTDITGIFLMFPPNRRLFARHLGPLVEDYLRREGTP